MGRLLRVLLSGCEVCGKRRTCWRWHVESFACPTCKREVSEFDSAFPDVIAASSVTWKWITTTGPTATTGGTFTWKNGNGAST
jgi:hypothetical protein